MLTSATTDLIHSVLDGEASAAQAQALQQALDADPTARAEYTAMSHLFAELGRLPKRHPPEGLVAAVMAAVDTPSQRSHNQNQLFSRPRVFSAGPRDSVPRAFNNPRLMTRLSAFLRSIDMSDQQPSGTFGNRKLWIGGATAAAALLVWQFGFSQRPMEKDVMGTIAPAERYRAPQPGADVKVGTPTVGQSTSTAIDATGAAANNAAANSANNAAANVANNAAANAANNAAANAANNAAANVANNAAANSANNAAANAANNAAANAANNAAANAAANAANNAAANAANNAAKNAAQGTVR